jgi:hypothetical protein
MGYTNYWTDSGTHQAIPTPALRIIKTVLDHAYQAGIVQREYDDSRPPVVTAEEIRFNGIGELGHETFGFRTGAPDPFGFCKTARKPYDDVVMRVLLVLACYRPGFELSSDGAFDHEWIEALDWFNQKVGRVYIKDQICFEMPGLDEPQRISTLSF